MLCIRTWEKLSEKWDQLEAVDRLVQRFIDPLEGAETNPAETPPDTKGN